MLQAWLENQDALTPTLLAAAAVLVLYATSRQSTKTRKQRIKNVSYVPASPLLGNILDMARNAERSLHWMTEECLTRDRFAMGLRFPGREDLVITSNPDHYEEIMKTQFHNFAKGDVVHDIMFDLMGDGVFIIDGDHWKFQRKVLVNIFSARLLREHITPIVQRHALVLQGIFNSAAATNESLNVFKLMHRFTLEAFAEIGFGCELGSLSSGKEHPFETAFDDAQLISMRRTKIPRWIWKLKRFLNVGSERRLREAIGVIDEMAMHFVSRSVERCRLITEAAARGEATPKVDKDLVSIIMENAESEGTPVAPLEVRNIAVAALVAGRDTTADALGWYFHVLSLNPRVEVKLRAELLASLPKLGTSDDYVPSLEEVQDLPYLEATIREQLRLYPALSFTAKKCIRDTVFADGVFIPEGTSVGICFYAMARIKSLWGEDATSFVPERFLDPETGKLLKFSPTKFSAFNQGPRVCVGRNLALMEMKIVIATIVSRFHLMEVPGQEVTYSNGLTLGMKNPLMMDVERVHAAEKGASVPSA